MKGLTLAFVLVVAMTVFWSIRCGAEAIIHGPYLIDMTETEVTIVWVTDVVSTGKAEYGTGWLTRLDGATVGDTREFTTMSRDKPEFTFWFLADVHAFLPSMDAVLNLVDYNDCDFFAYDGDMAAANGVPNMAYI